MGNQHSHSEKCGNITDASSSGLTVVHKTCISANTTGVVTTKERNPHCKQSEHPSSNTTFSLSPLEFITNQGKKGNICQDQKNLIVRDCLDFKTGITRKDRPKFAMNKVSPLPKPADGAKAILTAGSNIILSGHNISSGVEKFAKCLVQYTTGGSDLISKEIFQTHVVPKSRLASEYLWDFFKEYSDAEAISEKMFLRSADKIYAQITDKEQVHFYVKMFGKGKDYVQRNAFNDFLQSAYQLSSVVPGSVALNGTNNLDKDLEDGKAWLESVTKSCFHIKEEMSVFFLSNWILTNLQRTLIQMHKCIINQLTTGYQTTTKTITGPNEALEDSPDWKVSKSQYRFPGVNPILLWLLSCSLPDRYLSGLKPKPEQGNVTSNMLNSKQLLEMITSKPEPESWTILYDSDEDGTSINRFQFHVFNYRGPSLMFITADNGYQICIGSDSEWKESCHFWGGADSIIVQLQPEFRIVERGEKILYANFSIRGYPFGIQAGKDVRNVSVDVKPDFQLFSFKKIPCKILKIFVYGCAPPQAKDSQKDYRKWEAKECQKQTKINMNSAEWKENPDKYLLELAGNYKSYENN